MGYREWEVLCHVTDSVLKTPCHCLGMVGAK